MPNIFENSGIAMAAIESAASNEQPDVPHEVTDATHGDATEATQGEATEHAGDATHGDATDAEQIEASALLLVTAGVFKKLMQPRLSQIIGDGPA